VVKLNEIIPEGPRPLEEVRNQVETLVINNKRKEKITGQISDLASQNADLESLAASADKEVQTVDGLSMNDEVISGAGREPKVIGAIFGLQEGEQSEIIEGSNAAFVIKVMNRQDASLDNLTVDKKEQIRRQLQQQKSSSFTQVWLEQLKEEATIEDYRASVLQSR